MVRHVEHLKREWSVENILFYDVVAKFCKQCDEAAFEGGLARASTALDIYAGYIAESAPSRVRQARLCELTSFTFSRLALSVVALSL